MNDHDFITYFLKALQRGCRSFPGHEYARLCRIAGEEELSNMWMERAAMEQVSCDDPKRMVLLFDSLEKAVKRCKQP